jgi:hypothetical protein
VIGPITPDPNKSLKDYLTEPDNFSDAAGNNV